MLEQYFTNKKTYQPKTEKIYIAELMVYEKGNFLWQINGIDYIPLPLPSKPPNFVNLPTAFFLSLCQSSKTLGSYHRNIAHVTLNVYKV